MPLYTFRCSCGYEVDQAFQGTPPEALDWDDHPVGPVEDSSRTLCCGMLKRVWGNTALNLGYLPVKHTKNEQWLFTNG